MIRQCFELLTRLVYEKDMRIRLETALGDTDIFGNYVKGGVGDLSEPTLPAAGYLDIRRFGNGGKDLTDEQEKYVKGYQNMERLKNFSSEEIPLRVTIFRTADTSCAIGITWDDHSFSADAIDKLKCRISAMTGPYVKKADTVFELVSRQGVNYPDRKLLVFVEDEGQKVVTAGRLLRDVCAVSSYLLERAGSVGRAVIAGGTSYPWMLAFFSVIGIGGTAVILEPDIGAEQAKKRMEQVGADLIIGEEELLAGFEDENYTGICFSDISAVAKANDDNDGTAIMELPKASPDDIAAIFFTSGTTGYNKAVPLTHDMMTSYVKDVVDLMGTVEKALQFLPLYHIAGITTLLCDIHYGATAVIISDYRKMIETIATQGVKYAVLVPRLADILLLWLKEQDGDPHEIMEGFDLEYISVGGAKSNVDYTKEFEPFGIEAYDVYGMTESCGGMLFGNRPLPQMSVKIEPHDDRGELLVKGPIVFNGYLDDEEATRQVFKDGWFCTGDLVERQKDGRIFIIGRVKNLIILSNGENVSPEELENILQQSALISEARVYEHEDRIAAEIFADEEAFSGEDEKARQKKIEEEVRLICAGLPAYKQVAKVVLRNEPLQRNVMGKIVRRQED